MKFYLKKNIKLISNFISTVTRLSWVGQVGWMEYCWWNSFNTSTSMSSPGVIIENLTSVLTLVVKGQIETTYDIVRCDNIITLLSMLYRC